MNVPEIGSVAALAAGLEMAPQDLNRFSRAAHKLYRCWDEPKPSGGKRRIEAPFQELKRIQQFIGRHLLQSLPIHSSLHGGPGTSQITAARVHLKKEVVLTLDLVNFFPTVSSRQVASRLFACGMPAELAEMVTRLCTLRRRLPQGAPTSPVLARLVLGPILTRIQGAVGSVSNADMTQYVDDLAISGPAGVQRIIPLIKRIFSEHGFEVNPKKIYVMKSEGCQTVLGLKVNRRLEVSQTFVEKLQFMRRTTPPNDPRRIGMEAWRRKVEGSN